jgi:hypothetical protein
MGLRSLHQLDLCRKPIRNRHDGLGRTDIFAGAAAGTLLRDDGIDSALQDNGPALFGAPFKASAAEQGLVPGKTNLTVQSGLPQLGLLKIHSLKRFRGADAAAFHTEHTRGPPGKNLRGTSPAKEQVKPGAEHYAIKGADLGTLAAM